MNNMNSFFHLAEILGCPGLREAANMEIWLSRPQRGQEGQSSKVGSFEKARTTQNWGQISKKVTLYGQVV